MSNAASGSNGWVRRFGANSLGHDDVALGLLRRVPPTKLYMKR